MKLNYKSKCSTPSQHDSLEANLQNEAKKVIRRIRRRRRRREEKEEEEEEEEREKEEDE